MSKWPFSMSTAVYAKSTICLHCALQIVPRGRHHRCPRQMERCSRRHDDNVTSADPMLEHAYDCSLLVGLVSSITVCIEQACSNFRIICWDAWQGLCRR